MGDNNSEIKRKNIHVNTFKKIEDFLNKQESPVFKSDIRIQVNVDYNSINLALTMINHEIYEDGRISVKKKKC